MKNDVYQGLNVWIEDYQRFKKRKESRAGMSLAGLFHEMLEKTEPQPRNNNGKFVKKES